MSGVAPGGQDGGAEKIRMIGIFIWLIAALFFLYEFFLRTSLGSLAPQIKHSLNLTPETFAMLGSAYYLTYGLMQVPVGIIVDRLGVKTTMVFACTVCGISAFIFASAESFGLGLTGRMVMGFGSSFAFICLLIVARAWFPKKYFGLFAGLSQFVGTLGPILAGGPLIAFLKHEHIDWETFFYGLGFFGFVLAVLSLLFVTVKKRRDPQRIIYIQPGISLKQQVAQLLTNGQAWSVAIYSSLIYTCIATLGAIEGSEVLTAKGISEEVAADFDSLLWVGYAIGCPVMGWLSDFIRRRTIVMSCLGVLAVSSTGLLWLLNDASAEVYAVIFFCIGFTGGAPNVGFATIVEKVSDKIAATSLGMNNGLMLITDTMTPIVFGFLVTLTLVNPQQENLDASNYIYALGLLPILCLIATLVSVFLIRETYCRPQQDMIIVSPQTMDSPESEDASRA